MSIAINRFLKKISSVTCVGDGVKIMQLYRGNTLGRNALYILKDTRYISSQISKIQSDT